MKETLTFTISRKADNLHREPVQVPCDTENLYIQVDLPDEFRYMSFIIVEDPDAASGCRSSLPGENRTWASGQDRRIPQSEACPAGSRRAHGR